MTHYIAEGLATPMSERRPEDGFKLCQACSKLNLQHHDFLVARMTDTGHDHGLPISGRLFRRSSECLASKRQIMANHQTCPLCSLIVKSLAMTSTDADVNDDDMLTVKWEIDGRRELMSDRRGRSNNPREDTHASAELRPLTRRLRLTWGVPRMSDIYLMLVAPNTYHRANHDLAGNWDAKALFLGRSIDTRKSNEVLMLSWLRSCITHHRDKCCPTEEESSKMLKIAESSWFAVIDVYEMCLKSLPIREGSLYDHEPYAILSYVWGNKDRKTTSAYITTKANVLFHQTMGALEDRWSFLPETVRNAITLTKTLGLRYIWVDRLCIIQDSPRSCRLNINEMDTIYSNAQFTICAADGADADVGLKALLPHQRQRTKQLIEQCGPVKLMATQLTECVIKKSVWNSRAWAFQERILSKRSFVFCQGRVYFQCRQSTMAEDIVAEPQGGGWSLELAQSPHQILNQLEKRPIVVYMDCVSLYSKREMSNSQDILSAFNGISNIFGRAMNALMVFGLPTSYFDLALLWHPTKVVKRRTAEQRSDSIISPFPSWAWCGWQPSENRKNKDAAIEYSRSMLEGCLDSVRDFLQKRTWIQYFIRDDQGELRPIRDSSPDPTKIEKRWRGYGSTRPSYFRAGTFPVGTGQCREDTMTTTRHLAPTTMSRKVQFPPHTQISASGFRDRSSSPEGERPGIDVPIYPKTEVAIYPKTSVDGHSEETGETRSEASGRPNHFEKDREWNVDDRQMDAPSIYDTYDQPTRILVHSEASQPFRKIYADSPYRVRMAPPERRPTSETPDQAILQFWTWSARLYLRPSEARSQDVSDLQRFDILDLAGDWCGTILLDPDCQLLQDHEEMNIFGEPHRYEFIALSEAKNFTSDECKAWTYYSPNNQDQSEWELCHCLLVEDHDYIMYRVGLGKVFMSAFRGSSYKEIILG